MTQLKIGCCGFGMAQQKYFEKFSVLEVQQTFYQPPELKTLAKWRSNAAEDFEFVLKAWQLITHTSKSPTFRRLKQPLSEPHAKQAGEFKLNTLTKDAHSVTLACANELSAKSILFQCPASFTQTEKHIENMRKYFSSIERPEGMQFYWEPRGDWELAQIRELCEELSLFHAVDPFTNDSATPQHLYFRLHGIGGYRHVYSDPELDTLCEKVPARVAERRNLGYVFFNNVTMTKDASRFLDVLQHK